MATILEEFLIKLGFQVDPAQHSRFQDAMKESHERIEKFSKGLTDSLSKFGALATAASGSALSIVAAMGKISEALAGTSYAADRMNVSIGTIRSMDTALKSVGGSAGQAQNIMERLSTEIAKTPGFLAQFGIDPNTKPDQAMLQLGELFRRQIQSGNSALAAQLMEAAHLSWQEGLMLANPQMRPTFEASQQRRQGQGLDDNAIREQAERANRLLAQVQDRFQNFTDWLYTTWGKEFNDALEHGLAWFDTNLPKIKTSFLAAEDSIKAFIDTVEGWWKSLSPAGKENIEAITAIAVLMRLGSLPILGKVGQITAVVTAIGYLIQGYEHWKQTGQSEGLINWDKWGPPLEKAVALLEHFNNDIIGPLADKLGVDRTFLPAFEALAAYLAGPALLRAVLGGGLGSLLKMLAFIPGSGVTSKLLGALGIAGVAEAAGVVAGVEVGKMGIATPEQEEAAKHPVDLGGKEKMSASEASRRVQEDLSRMQNQPTSWGGRMWSGAMSALGLGGKIDPGQAHTADEIVQYMVAQGWTKEQAQGVAANAIAESGGRPRIVNASGHAGIFQWDQNRQQTFARMFGHTMTDQGVSDEQLFREELDFANWELHNTESVAGKRLADTSTAEEATVAFGQGYERYANGPSPEDAHRVGIVQQIKHGGAPGGPAPADVAARQGAVGPTGGSTGSKAAPAPDQPGGDVATATPFGDAPLTTKPGETTPDQWSPNSPFWRGIMNPPDLGATTAPAAPPAATINNNAGDTHVSNNQTFAPNINVTGVQQPQRTAELIDRNLQRQWTEWGVHNGAAYT